MNTFVLAAAASLLLGMSPALAECNISDAKLEEAILQKPELRDPANRQMVRDLRALRDSAFILWSYGRHDDCERVLASIRDLVASPSMGKLGGNDEDEADQQFAAREPMAERGGAVMGRQGMLTLNRSLTLTRLVRDCAPTKSWAQRFEAQTTRS